MQLFTTFAASMLAICASAQETPITGPFYLTVLVEGKELPTSIIPVSRGVPILSPWEAYTQLFTYNTTNKRIYSFDKPGLGSFQVDDGLPTIFTSDEPVEDSELEQLDENGAIYLIKEGTSEKGALGWNTRSSGFPANFFWPGQGSEEANAKLRIDLQNSTSH